jgi:hypothetical protein
MPTKTPPEFDKTTLDTLDCVKDPAFRQMLLYFIRLTLHILGNMLHDYYQSANKKTQKRRRKHIRCIVENDETLKTLKERTFDCIKDPNHISKRSCWLFDFSTKPSTRVLKQLDPSAQENLRTFLVQEVRYSELHSIDYLIRLIERSRLLTPQNPACPNGQHLQSNMA